MTVNPTLTTHSTAKRPRAKPAVSSPIVAWADIETPLGAMTAMATAQGLAALWFDARERYPDVVQTATQSLNHHAITAARRWLDAYWAGHDTSRVEVPLDLHGTHFQRAVWRQLQLIAHGHTRTYGEVATGVGGGAVARATGAACGANPVGVIVPCHRVVGANGSLTGFAAGLPRKQALLVHEGALLT